MFALAVIAFICAFIPAALYLRNVQLYRTLPPANREDSELPPVSVLISACDDEPNVRAAVENVLASRGVSFEVLVLGGHSGGDAAAMDPGIDGNDARVRFISGGELPPGWCAKSHARQQLAEAAAHELMLFLDPGVRLAPVALGRIAAFMRAHADVAAASGIPRQITTGLMEQLLVPLLHWVLLAFLPMKRMRRTASPSLSAAAGQLLVCRRGAYQSIGGHDSGKNRFQDSLALVRALRAAGHRTDVFDPSTVASARVHESAGAVWRSFVRTASESFGHPGLVGLSTLLLLAGQILPCVLRFTIPDTEPGAQTLAAWALLFAFLPRLLAAFRFRQPFSGVALHPFCVLMLLAIQWEGLIRRLAKSPVKGQARACA